jgi:excisionase family DNA binding protein
LLTLYHNTAHFGQEWEEPKENTMDKSTKRLLTLMECESRTGRKVSTWRKAIAKREIPFVRIGRSVRIPQEIIEDLVSKGWRDPVKTLSA